MQEQSTHNSNVPPPSNAVKDFVDLSSALTGFERIDLWGTGMVGVYYDALNRVIGERETGKLLGASSSVIPRGRTGDERQIEVEILENHRYGPVARNIIRLWYLGTWAQLPAAWRDEFGATSADTDHVISGAAYVESLVWVAGETHPMGAKQQGFGEWGKPGTPTGV